MLLYAITQRSLFPGDETARAEALLAQARHLARGGVHYLQIREKDLPLPALQALAAQAVAVSRSQGSSTKVLLNGPASVALAAGCDGIHLASDAPSGTALAARNLYRQAQRDCIVSAACHSLSEVRDRSRYADLLLFSPVFEKVDAQSVIQGVGLATLSKAVTTANAVPVLALGGVTAQNTRHCLAAGAAGVAAIRLFMGEDWISLVD